MCVDKCSNMYISGESRGPVKNMTASGALLTATVKGLHPSYIYDIRIRARNAVGLGLTSHQVSAKMWEEGNVYISSM